MKRYVLSVAIAVSAFVGAGAQSINFTSGGVTYSYRAETAGEMLFSGPAVTVAGRTFDLNVWSHAKVVNDVVADNTVDVRYSGHTATVTVAGNISPYVDVAVTEAGVVIDQAETVSDATCGEITYVLSGESADGSFRLNGNYKSTIELQGLSLTNTGGAAIDIQNGKRIAMSVKNGTVNSLADGTGSQKGALVCKGHLELKGKGSLSVSGNCSHAIYAKEYISIKNLTLDIAKSVKDGINCGQYLLMESGKVNVGGVGDDCIQVSYKDEIDRTADDTGSISVRGGELTATVTADAAKCLKAEGDILIAGGTLDFMSTANGLWDSNKLKTKASACIGADGDVTISGGEISLKATGSGGKGVSCDGVFTSEGGKLTIVTTGGMLVYSNGTLNHNYTSSADRISSDNKSSSKGVKADGGVVINDGNIYITTATNNAEGIESKKELDINGGTVFVKAYDDGINSSNDMRISGGDVTVISIVGDGLDSNGNLTVSGGTVRTMGSGGAEMGLDAATEDGYAVFITGGTLMAFGGSNSYPTKSGSTQAFVYTSTSISAGNTVEVKSGNDVYASFTVPSEYSSSTSAGRGFGNGPGSGGWGPGGASGSGVLMISCPQLVSGQSYSLTNGANSVSVKAMLTSFGR